MFSSEGLDRGSSAHSPVIQSPRIQSPIRDQRHNGLSPQRSNGPIRLSPNNSGLTGLNALILPTRTVSAGQSPLTQSPRLQSPIMQSPLNGNGLNVGMNVTVADESKNRRRKPREDFSEYIKNVADGMEPGEWSAINHDREYIQEFLIQDSVYFI